MNLIKQLWGRIPKSVIHNCEGNKYLTRWYLIRFKPFAFFLHLFHRSDEDRALHDHPWTFFSVILWRGYYEHYTVLTECPGCIGGRVYNDWSPSRKCGMCHATGKVHQPVKKRRWPLIPMYRPAEHSHRVELINEKPALTLILRMRGRREWGYHFPTGWISHHDWWRKNCE